MKSSFIRKTFIYFIGNFSSKLLTVLLIPIYAYFVNPDDLGNYDYITAIMNILVPICFFNMWDCILKYILKETDIHKIKEIFSTAFIFSSILSSAFMIGYYILYMLRIIVYPYFILSIFMMLSYGLVTFWQYSCRALQQNKLYAISGVVSSFINVSLILILVIWKQLGLIGLIIAYTVAMLSSVLLMENIITIRKYISIKNFNLELLKKMITFSAPIVLNTVSLWGLTGISKIICVNYLDASANGIFSFASKFGNIITIIGSILGAVIIEEAYLEKNISSYRKRFSKLIRTIFTSYLIIVIICIPILYSAFDMFFVNSSYYSAKELLSIVLLGSIFGSISTNFGSAFQVTERTNYVFITSLIGSIFSIGVSLLSISEFGIYAITFGQMLGSLMLMLSRAFFAYKLTKLKIKWIQIILLICLFIFVSCISIFTPIYVNIMIVVIMLILVLYVLVNKVKKVEKS